MDEDFTPFASEYPPDDFGQPAALEAEPSEPAVSPLSYRLDWDEEKRKKLARRLCNQLDRYEEATRHRRGLVAMWRQDWEVLPGGRGAEDGDGPHPNCSDVTAALTRTACNAYHARLNTAILLNDPPMAVVARDEEAVEAAPLIEEAMPASLEEAEWPIHADEVHEDLPAAGNVFLRLTYDIETAPKPVLEVEYEPEDAAALVMAGRDPVTAAYGALQTDAQGRIKRTLTFKQEVVYQGLRLRMIPWEDGIVLPATCRRIEDACGIGERLVILGEELRRGAKQGKYLRDAVDELLKQSPDAIPEDQEERYDAQGVHPTPEHGEDAFTEDGDHEGALYHEYLCHELCYKLDGNGDGYPEWCWITLHKPTQTILRLQYLPWEHGQAHYHLFKCLNRPGQLWGQGIAELVATHQDGLTALINQGLDINDLANAIATTLFCDDQSGIKPDSFEMRLGQINKCDNVAGILQLKQPTLSPDHYRWYEALKQDAERLTGASDPAIGRPTPGDNTLGEIKLAIGHGNIQFENTAAAVARQWARVWDQARFLLAQYGEGGEVRYRKTAAAGSRIQTDEMGIPRPAPALPEAVSFESIPAEMLRKRVDLVPAGLASMSDVQTRIQQAQLLWGEMTQNPMLQPYVLADPQLLLLGFDHYLQQMRVPIRQRLMARLEAAVNQKMAMDAMLQAAAEQQAAGALDAQTAGAEAGLMAEAAQAGMPPEMLAGGGAMPPMNGAAPPMGIAA